MYVLISVILLYFKFRANAQTSSAHNMRCWHIPCICFLLFLISGFLNKGLMDFLNNWVALHTKASGKRKEAWLNEGKMHICVCV